MSFSKTSIFCLIALFAIGCLFMVTPAEATDPDGATHDPTDPADHTHTTKPTVKSIGLVNVMTKGTGARPTGNDTVSFDTVTLVDDVDGLTNITIVNLEATSGVSQFQLEVTFSEDVFDADDYDDLASSLTARDADLAGSELTVTAAARSAPTANLFGNGVNISTIARKVTQDDQNNDITSKTTFLVTFEVDSGLYDEIDHETDPGIDVWFSVNEQAVSSPSLGSVLNNGVLALKHGNTNVASELRKFTIVPTLDNTAPTLTPSTPAVGTDGYTVTFTLTADAALGSGDDDLTSDDVTVTPTGSTFTVSKAALVYTITVVPPGTPPNPYLDLTVTVDEEGVKDVIGNALAADVVVPYDAPDLPPRSLTVTHAYNATNGKVTFTFTAGTVLATSGDGAFAFSDITITNASTATADDFVQSTTDSKIYTLAVTPDTEDNGQNKSVSVAVKAGAVADIWGNVSTTAATAAPNSSLTWTAPDTIPPVLTITNSFAGNNIVVFTFTFSEGLGSGKARFDINDIAVTNGSILGGLVNPATNVHTASIVRKVHTENLTVTVAKANVADVAGNNLAADAVSTYKEMTAPTLTVSHNGVADDGNDKTTLTGGKLTFTFTASEPLATSGDGEFVVGDIEVTGGTPGDLTKTAANDTATPPTKEMYTVDVTPTTMYTDVTIAVAIGAVEDMNGNASTTAATGDLDWTAPEADTTKPTLTITHSPSPTGYAVTFTFTFSEALGDGDDAFTSSDITVDNGTIIGGVVSPKTNVYTAAIEVTKAAENLTVTVAADAVADVEGNNLAAAVSETYTETTVPTLTVTHSPADNTVPTGGKLTFTFTASEPLATSGNGEFVVGDIEVTGGTLGDLTKTAADDTATPPTKEMYTVEATPNAPNTDVTVTVAAGAVEDMNGNASTTAATGDLTWTAPTASDTTKPTVTITSTPASGAELPKTGAMKDKVIFNFAFSENLGTGSDAFALSDVKVTGGSKEDFYEDSDDPTKYNLVVMPTDRTTDVTVEITGTVQDTSNNDLDTAGATFTYKHYDTTHPTVLAMLGDEISATGADEDKLVKLTFVFDEPIDGFTIEDIDRTRTNVLLSDHPTKDATYTFKASHVGVGVDSRSNIAQPTYPERVEAWTLRVRREPAAKKTDPITVSIETQSLTDKATPANELEEDFVGTYTYVDTREGEKPVVKIEVVDRSLDGRLRQRMENAIKITLTDNVGVTDGLTEGEVTASGAQITDFVPGKSTVTLNVTPYIGTVQVKITVPADKVKDADGNGNILTELPVEVDPVIEVPANGFRVVTKSPSDPVYTFLSDDPYQTVHQGSIVPHIWKHMPDLERLFDIKKSSTAIGGEGGGALILKKATEQATLNKGDVRIREIMWASDLKYLGALNDAEAKNQWIELQNHTSSKVYVHLFDRKGSETITVESDEIDRVGNFYNGSIGNDHWSVKKVEGVTDGKGQNGNSHDGTDFVSMHRTGDNGMAEGSWKSSVTNFLAAVSKDGNTKLYHHVGTPGRPHPSATDEPPVRQTTKIESNTIIFNEVANRNSANQAYEWIELKNVSNAEINLKNYRISAVTAVGIDRELYTFPNNNNTKLGAGKVLLLVETEPKNNRNHPLQAGSVDYMYKVVDFKHGGLPDSGNFVLLLRNTNKLASSRKIGASIETSVAGVNKAIKDNGIHGDNDATKSPVIVDIAGHHPNLKVAKYQNNLFGTDLWPLLNYSAPQFTNNKLEVEKVHYRRHRRGKTSNAKDGRSGVGAVDDNNGKTAFADIGYTGVGYKRLSATTAVHGGTPGYPNNAFQSSGNTIRDSVYISEIMYADNEAGVLPQWIELRNISKTTGANLHNVRLTIVNHSKKADGSDWRGRSQGTTLLRDLRIKPNSTVLIASRRSVQTIGVPSVYMPDSDIFLLWNRDRGGFGMTRQNDDVINTHGFKITLHANGHEGDKNKWQLIDEASNLSTKTDVRGTLERFEPTRWSWPMAIQEGTGNRISVVRRMSSNATKGMWVSPGTGEKSWQLSTEDPGHNDVAAYTYYGNIDDISSPGQTHGLPLPVELSSFQPTLEDGKVVVRWTTESELDNAGFNIYRSETRGGEFKQVNAQLVEGAGTTGERNTYEWVDTTAKPDVVYYYQIEDVSFSGERQTLAESRLKGYVSAKNKLTTRWGELKKTLQ